MIQVTVFSGHVGELCCDKALYLTVFAGCTLSKPTVARRVMLLRDHHETRMTRRKPFFFTLFGGVDVKSPTMAAEFIDMREMLNSKTLTMNDWDGIISRIGSFQDSVGSLTLFGAWRCALPTENEEIDSLALQCHLGNIEDPARKILQTGIGQNGSERLAVLRRALLRTA